MNHFTLNCWFIPCVEAWSKVKQKRKLGEHKTKPFYQEKPQSATEKATKSEGGKKISTEQILRE